MIAKIECCGASGQVDGRSINFVLDISHELAELSIEIESTGMGGNPSYRHHYCLSEHDTQFVFENLSETALMFMRMDACGGPLLMVRTVTAGFSLRFFLIKKVSGNQVGIEIDFDAYTLVPQSVANDEMSPAVTRYCYGFAATYEQLGQFVSQIEDQLAHK